MKARFSRSDAMSERLGETCDVVIESEWFQLTYDRLRSAPEGEIVATYDSVNDWWLFKQGPAYSDVVLFDEPGAPLVMRDQVEASLDRIENLIDTDQLTRANLKSLIRGNLNEAFAALRPEPQHDDGRDVRHEQLRRRLGDDEYEYLRTEAKIEAEG